QRTAEAASLKFLIDREAAQTEDRHVVAGKALFGERRRAAVFERCGTQRVETENPGGRVGQRGDEALCTATVMVLARVALQIDVEVGIAAVEGGAIMMLCERGFRPDHRSLNPAFAARTRRAGAFGGFSSNS